MGGLLAFAMMTRLVGDRTTFALEIGDRVSAGLQVVDVWASGVRLTAVDNVAYVPSFCRYLRRTAEQVARRRIKSCPFPGRSPEEIFRLLDADQTEIRERYWLMRWSEILDNVSTYAYLDDDLVIVFKLRRAGHPIPQDPDKVLVSKIQPDLFATLLQTAADLLTAR